jgi:hypothetical protein
MNMNQRFNQMFGGNQKTNTPQAFNQIFGGNQKTNTPQAFNQTFGVPQAFNQTFGGNQKTNTPQAFHLISREELKRLSWEEGKSDVEIASLYNVTPNQVNHKRRQMNLIQKPTN